MPMTWTRVRDYEDIRYEHSGTGIARITIDRQHVRNAFRPETVDELIDAFRRVRDDSSIGVVLLTGAGEVAFCSGGDMTVKGEGGYIGGDGTARLNVLDLQRLIRSLPIVVIALVNGFAIGGGHVLHVVCDLTIASENAVFGQTGPKVGSFDGGYGATLLARIVGHKKAREMWYLCRQYTAPEALAMGLVNAVVPLERLLDEGVAWADEILAKSPTADPDAEALLQRRHGRPGRPPGARRRRDDAVLPDRGGARGQPRLPGEASTRLLAIPAAALSWVACPVPSSVRWRRHVCRGHGHGSSPADRPRCRPRWGRCSWALASRWARASSCPLPAAASLAVALLLQVASNLANDLLDFRSGADTADRLGPPRAAALGLLSQRELSAGIAVVLGLAGLVGLYLVSVGGWPILVLGLLAVVSLLAYTGGPWPYGYHGLGEVFVFVFFGLVAVAGTTYLQTGRLEPLALAAAVPVGALVTAILVVNNLRDIESDRKAGKRTLAVRVGERGAVTEYELLIAVAYLVPVALLLAWTLPSLGFLLPLLSLPLALPLLRVVRAGGDPRRLNAILRGTARLSLAHSVLLAVGMALPGLA